MLKTTITGSLPRPAWLAEPGKHQYRDWCIPSDYVSEAHDDAVRLAIADQEEAGMILGEQATSGANILSGSILFWKVGLVEED